tara:strand:+ start:2818 stop:2991 length:174 start_codon:yes stop_codon:yes gene_type:complete
MEENKNKLTNNDRQITKWLTMGDIDYLRHEKKRLSNKGWVVEIRNDEYDRISLWRTS